MRFKIKTPANSKHFLLLLLGIFSLGCGEKQPFPEFRGKIYILDSHRASLRRKQENEEIPVNDPRVDGSIVFSPEDFENFVNSLCLPSSKRAP
jgi:hypothetical protein